MKRKKKETQHNATDTLYRDVLPTASPKVICSGPPKPDGFARSPTTHTLCLALLRKIAACSDNFHYVFEHPQLDAKVFTRISTMNTPTCQSQSAARPVLAPISKSGEIPKFATKQTRHRHACVWCLTACLQEYGMVRAILANIATLAHLFSCPLLQRRRSAGHHFHGLEMCFTKHRESTHVVPELRILMFVNKSNLFCC